MPTPNARQPLSEEESRLLLSRINNAAPAGTEAGAKLLDELDAAREAARRVRDMNPDVNAPTRPATVAELSPQQAALANLLAASESPAQEPVPTELVYRVGINEPLQLVVIEFNRPQPGMSFRAQQAIELAEKLIACAQKVATEPLSICIPANVPAADGEDVIEVDIAAEEIERDDPEDHPDAGGKSYR